MKTLLFVAAISFPLLACGDTDTVVPTAPIKAVKTITVTADNQANSRQLSGIVNTSNQTDLSFRVGGRVATMAADAGDAVTTGQVLATLDQREYVLAVDSAKAELASARADLAEKTDALRRQQSLRTKGFTTQAALDQAQAAFSAAKSKSTIAQTKLENAQTDLDNATLRAPFAGSIISRSVEPFTVVTSGQTIFELQSSDGYEVDVLMPETLIQDVSFGDLVRIRFPSSGIADVIGTVSRIATRAEEGNAFLVSVTLGEPVAGLRAGITAQVIFNFGQADGTPVYLIPISALDVRIPAQDDGIIAGEAPVFVLNPATSQAERRMVAIRDIRGNAFEVVDGLSDGDMIIVAGVPALSDGQQVKQWAPTYNKPATITQPQ